MNKILVLIVLVIAYGVTNAQGVEFEHQAVKDLFDATPEDYQADMLNDMFVLGKDRLAGKSAHGTGKSTTLSWMGWIFLMTRPMSRVVATAPVQAQLRDVLS